MLAAEFFTSSTMTIKKHLVTKPYGAKTQQLLSERIRHQSPFACVLLVFSHVTASKVSLIYVQGCEKRNLTQIQKPGPKIRSENSDFRNLDRSGGVEEVSSFKPRQIQLSRSYRGAVEETGAFSIDPPAIERCRAIFPQVSRGVEQLLSYLSAGVELSVQLL